MSRGLCTTFISRSAVGLVAFLAAALIAVPAAMASTTVGQTGSPTAVFQPNDEHVTTAGNYTMPGDGIVTSLNTKSSSCGLGATGVFNLQVVRPVGGNQYQVLGETGNQTDPCNSTLNSYPVSIRVQAGDLLAVYIVTPWQGALAYGTNAVFNTAISEPAVGDTFTATTPGTGIADESATLTALCSPGSFSASGGEPCTDAPAGSFVDTTGATSATLCPVGSYQPDTGQTSCLPAPVGSYVSTTGATSATACPAGLTTTGTGSTSIADCMVPTATATCKQGRWQDLTDDRGTPFKNQGDCVSYVATGGTNPAAGG